MVSVKCSRVLLGSILEAWTYEVRLRGLSELLFGGMAKGRICGKGGVSLVGGDRSGDGFFRRDSTRAKCKDSKD